MTTSELIKRLRDKLAAFERSETPLTDYELRICDAVHDLLWDLEDGKRFNDSYVAVLATFLLNDLLPDAIEDPVRKAKADEVMRKAWKEHCGRFLIGLGITWKRLGSALEIPVDRRVVINVPEGFGKAGMMKK